MLQKIGKTFAGVGLFVLLSAGLVVMANACDTCQRREELREEHRHKECLELIRARYAHISDCGENHQ